jgi:hypothetical protein
MMEQAMRDWVMQDLAAGYPDMSEGELANVVSLWQLTPYAPKGVLGGIGMSRGSEFHFLQTPEFSLDRKAMRESIAPLFEKFGFLTTRLLLGDISNQRFNRLFGFQPTWSDKTFQFFMMTKLPFGERTTCQQ